LVTRAELKGDEWIVEGEKVWNTGSQIADYGMLLARTDWDVPKHSGITYFILPMHQPGVEVRPIKQMNAYSSFNQVFLTEARIPADHLVGTVGDGWQIALTTLAYERRYGTMPRRRYRDVRGSALTEAKREADEFSAVYSWYAQRAGRVDLAMQRARMIAPAIRGSSTSEEVSRLYAMHRANEWTAERAKAVRAAGQIPGPEGSIGKLALSALARHASKVHTRLWGAEALLGGATGPMEGMIEEIILSVPAQSIAGGTDEIQRTILAERALGLPRDSSLERDISFRELLKNP
jgi:alkylation response protein AidB-like acyl-CoA dehydrogenase